MDRLLHRHFTRRRFIGASASAAAALGALACTPGAPAPIPESAQRGVSSRSALATVQVGAAGGRNENTRTAPIPGGQRDTAPITGVPLSLYDHDGNVVPGLAERLPSFDDGSWVVNQDGTMRLTWPLRRNVRWHDGQPFTARDIVFSWELQSDSSLPWEPRPFLRNVSAIDAPDDYTIVTHYRVSSPFANAVPLQDFLVFPEHVLRPQWEAGEGERIFSHDFFHDGFVGLGAYRIDRWNPDDAIVLKPFPEFFLGPPKIGTIVTRRYADSQALLTGLLADAVHITGALSLRLEDALVAKEQWAATGQGTVHFTPVGFMRLNLSPRNPLFQDVRVRQALLHAIDRDEIVGTIFRGSTVAAHTLLHPNEIDFKAADAAIPKYGFDPRQALALLDAAGWRRGSDGVLANASGDRFEFPYRVPSTDAEQNQVQGAIQTYWRDIGVRAVADNVSAAVHNDRTERARYPGTIATMPATNLASLYRRWHSSQIPREASRFIGDNEAEWNNPAADRLLDGINGTVDIRLMAPQLVELAKVFSQDLPCLPIYFAVEPVAIRSSLRNARPRPNSSGDHTITWDAYQWEWE